MMRRLTYSQLVRGESIFANWLHRAEVGDVATDDAYVAWLRRRGRAYARITVPPKRARRTDVYDGLWDG